MSRPAASPLGPASFSAADFSRASAAWAAWPRALSRRARRVTAEASSGATRASRSSWRSASSYFLAAIRASAWSVRAAGRSVGGLGVGGGEFGGPLGLGVDQELGQEVAGGGGGGQVAGEVVDELLEHLDGLGPVGRVGAAGQDEGADQAVLGHVAAGGRVLDEVPGLLPGAALAGPRREEQGQAARGPPLGVVALEHALEDGLGPVATGRWPRSSRRRRGRRGGRRASGRGRPRRPRRRGRARRRRARPGPRRARGARRS